MRPGSVALLLLGAAVALAAPAAARDAVRILALSDAFDPAVLDDVSRVVKADILVERYATTAEVEAALRAPGAAADLVLLPAEAVGTRVRADLLRPLDPDTLPEAAAVLPPLAAAIGPAAARVAVPFDWYPLGFAVNLGKLKEPGLPAEPAAGWDVLGRPDLLRRVLACGFGWPDDARDALAMAAAVTAGGTLDAAGRRQTLALLSQLRTEARKGGTAERADGLMGGDLCAAVLPAPDALAAAERARSAGVDLAFVPPVGGGPLVVDVLALPTAGHNAAGALATLRALLRPETVAANARATHVAPAVGSDMADPAFDPVLLGRLRVPPAPDAALARLAVAAWERGQTR